MPLPLPQLQQPPEPEPEARLVDLVPEGSSPCILDDGPVSQRRRPLTHSGLKAFVDGAFALEAARCGLPRGGRVWALSCAPRCAIQKGTRTCLAMGFASVRAGTP